MHTKVSHDAPLTLACLVALSLGGTVALITAGTKEGRKWHTVSVSGALIERITRMHTSDASCDVEARRVVSAR